MQVSRDPIAMVPFMYLGNVNGRSHPKYYSYYFYYYYYCHRHYHDYNYLAVILFEHCIWYNTNGSKKKFFRSLQSLRCWRDYTFLMEAKDSFSLLSRAQLFYSTCLALFVSNQFWFILTSTCKSYKLLLPWVLQITFYTHQISLPYMHRALTASASLALSPLCTWQIGKFTKLLWWYFLRVISIPLDSHIPLNGDMDPCKMVHQAKGNYSNIYFCSSHELSSRSAYRSVMILWDNSSRLHEGAILQWTKGKQKKILSLCTLTLTRKQLVLWNAYFWMSAAWLLLICTTSRKPVQSVCMSYILASVWIQIVKNNYHENSENFWISVILNVTK
jgi:hypothetical protein